MPFTAAHPALILPLKCLPKSWISMTGLIVGSMAPDFEYFIRMELESEHSHTIAGLFWFNLPLGLLLTFVYHGIVRDALLDSLPNVLQIRLAKFKQLNWTAYFKLKWPIVLLALLIGAGSHVLLDSFTHEHGYFAQSIPLLLQKINLFGFSIGVYKLLQHGGTLLGFAAISWAIWRIPADTEVKTGFDWRYWAWCAGIAAAIFAIRFFVSLNFRMHSEIIGSGIAAGILGLVFVSWGIREFRKGHSIRD